MLAVGAAQSKSIEMMIGLRIAAGVPTSVRLAQALSYGY